MSDETIDITTDWGTPGAALCMWTIYDHPSDFVVRLWKVAAWAEATDVMSLHDTLEEARSAIHDGLVCVRRNPKDDPVIVETWV